VRWDRLFDDLEGQLELAEREEFAAEVADRSRREVALVHLSDRLRQARGAPIELTVHGAGSLQGVIQRVGQGWLLLGVSSQPAALVASHAILAVRGLPGAATEPAAVGAVESRLDLGHALRVIARDRSPVTLVLRDGSSCAGTIDRVGADFLDLAEHAPGEPRRAGQVSGIRAVTFAGLAVVRSG
jgi:hypothetical protein